MHTSEVVKILQELAQSGLCGEVLFQKFTSATRGERKLACALHGFLLSESRDAYLRYLLARVRPAAAALILSENAAGLAALDAHAPFTEALTDEFLKTAINRGSQESIVWLLRH